MAQKKRKPLTKREKAERAASKKRLQEQGILPPEKPRLNRKKFAKEVLTEFEETMTDYGDYFHLYRAIGCMVSKDMWEVTPEAVGVLKLLKIAIESKKFSAALREEGRIEYTIGEFVEKVVSPVLKL